MAWLSALKRHVGPFRLRRLLKIGLQRHILYFAAFVHVDGDGGFIGREVGFRSGPHPLTITVRTIARMMPGIQASLVALEPAAPALTHVTCLSPPTDLDFPRLSV